MTLQLDVPPEVLELLGPEPERKVLEAVVLELVRAEKMTITRGGEILGLDRWEAPRWFASRGVEEYTLEEFQHDVAFFDQLRGRR
jgi:hypothetical protein